jgi:hypothetical protein
MRIIVLKDKDVDLLEYCLNSVITQEQLMRAGYDCDTPEYHESIGFTQLVNELKQKVVGK